MYYTLAHVIFNIIIKSILHIIIKFIYNYMHYILCMAYITLIFYDTCIGLSYIWYVFTRIYIHTALCRYLLYILGVLLPVPLLFTLWLVSMESWRYARFDVDSSACWAVVLFGILLKLQDYWGLWGNHSIIIF